MKSREAREITHFKPFIIEIEVENENDLKCLWYRFVLDIDDVIETSGGTRFTVNGDEGDVEIFDILEEKIKEFNIK